MSRSFHGSIFLVVIGSAAMLVLSACSEGSANVALDCMATVNKSEGWREGEERKRDGLLWAVYQDPYSSTKNQSSWEFIFEPTQLTIITDEVVGHKELCWMQCGRVKQFELSRPDVIMETGAFGGRFRYFSDSSFSKESWNLEWQGFEGFVISASGKFSMEFTDTSVNDPIQKEKFASIDFDC